MDFGQLYSFKFKKKGARRPVDRTIVFIEENKKMVLGLRLSGLPQPWVDKVMEIVNDNIFSKFSSNNRLISQALKSQKEISDRRLARMLMTGEIEKISKAETLKFMELLIGAYDKKNILDL